MKIGTQAVIAHWARETFGQSTNMRAATRANEEMAELLKALAIDEKHPKAPEELADILICMYRIAENLGVDLHDEVDKKMRGNYVRVWEKDGSGCAYHVPNPEERDGMVRGKCPSNNQCLACDRLGYHLEEDDNVKRFTP